MPTIASQQDLAAAAEPLLQHSNRGGATDARQDGEVCYVMPVACVCIAALPYPSASCITVCIGMAHCRWLAFVISRGQARRSGLQIATGPSPASRRAAAAAQSMDHTPGQCLRSVDFWLLWVANGIASGAGLTLLNNLGQQVRQP